MFRFLILFFTILCFQIPTAKSSEIEVISYNTALARALGKDFTPCVQERMIAILENVLKKSDAPTVFLFQELFFKEAYKSLARWAYENKFSITETDSQRSGLVILSELPIVTESWQKFSCNKFMRKQGALTATLSLKGMNIEVMNSHTNDSEAAAPDTCQLTQLNELGNFFNQRKNTTILGGDFNAGPDLKIINQNYDPIAKIWLPFRNLLAKTNAFRAPTENRGVTWDYQKNLLAHVGPQDNSTLDHLFFKGAVELADYGIAYDQTVDVKNCKDFETSPGKTYMSDHYGVRARIRL